MIWRDTLAWPETLTGKVIVDRECISQCEHGPRPLLIAAAITSLPVWEPTLDDKSGSNVRSGVDVSSIFMSEGEISISISDICKSFMLSRVVDDAELLSGWWGPLSVFCVMQQSPPIICGQKSAAIELLHMLNRIALMSKANSVLRSRMIRSTGSLIRYRSIAMSITLRICAGISQRNLDWISTSRSHLN